MTKTFLLLGLATVLIGATTTAAAHSPPATTEPETDALLHPLFLAYEQPNRTTQYYGSQPQADDGFRLSLSKESAHGSRSYKLSEPPVALVCAPYAACGSTGVKALATHTGEDLQIQRMDVVEGVLKFNWQFSAPLMQPYVGRAVATLHVGLSVGEDQYSHVQKTLTVGTHQVELPLQFHLQPSHHEACTSEPKRHNASSGSHTCETSNESTEPAEVWAHDVKLWFTLQIHRDPLGRPLGSNAQLVIAHDGQSHLMVREVPPPPPAEPEPAGYTEEISLVGYDSDGDGEVDMEELHFVPGASPAMVLAALAGLGILVRRLRR